MKLLSRYDPCPSTVAVPQVDNFCIDNKRGNYIDIKHM